MDPRQIESGYRFRPPRPSRFWQWALTGLRRRIHQRMYGVSQIELQGEEQVHTALAAGGVMFTVNHPAHGDPFVVFEAMDRLRASCCYMAAWQVMEGWMGLKPWAFQRLGVFSVDREGTDMRSFRTAVDVLADGRHSLVIFPEGDVYHLNDRITPMREGAAMIAVTAAKRRLKRTADRPLLLVPCALKYFYLQSPHAQLEQVMKRLEESIYWRPRNDLALVDRITSFAGAILALKEQEYLGEPGEGPLTERIARLSEHVLSSIEQRRSGRASAAAIPARVKQLRLDVLKSMGLAGADDEGADTPEAAANQAPHSLLPRGGVRSSSRLAIAPNPVGAHDRVLIRPLMRVREGGEASCALRPSADSSSITPRVRRHERASPSPRPARCEGFGFS